MLKNVGFGLLKKKWFVASGAGAVLFILVILVFWAKNGNYEIIEVKRGTISQEVEITGKTKPANNVDLAFERSGRVNSIRASVGDKVVAGQILITLETSELQAQLLDAQANADSQRAKLGELKSGARPEDIKIKEAELSKAKQDLTNDYLSVPDVLNSAYIKMDDAVRKQVDLIFSNDEEVTPNLTFGGSNSQLENEIKDRRANLTRILNQWSSELVLLGKNTDQTTLGAAISNAHDYLGIASIFFDKLSTHLSGAIGLSESTKDSYRASINTARTNVNAALSSINDQKQIIASQLNVVQTAQGELDLKLAGSTKDQIAAQEAQVRQAEAKVALVQAQIQKSVLYSPISGTVTKQDLRIGEVATPNESFLSIISENQLEIETNIPEINIGKIAMENPVEVNFDAFPGETFTGKVFYIDPAETLVNGVVNFKVKISFDKDDERFKSGLTTNLIIKTATEPNALFLPIYAVTEKDGGIFVTKLDGNALKETPVTLGMKDSKGNVQVLSGIQEGEKVINPVKS